MVHPNDCFAKFMVRGSALRRVSTSGVETATEAKLKADRFKADGFADVTVQDRAGNLFRLDTLPQWTEACRHPRRFGESIS